MYHAESDRLSWYKTGELLGKGDAKKFKEISFKITPNGLEQYNNKKLVKHYVLRAFYYSASETTVKRSFTCFGFSISSSAATAKSS